jgi:hypothetical protein
MHEMVTDHCKRLVKPLLNVLLSSCIPNRAWTKAGLKDALASVICFNVSNFQGLDFIVDGGPRIADPSTVVDMTGTNPTIIRQGKVSSLYLGLLTVHYLAPLLI